MIGVTRGFLNYAEDKSHRVKLLRVESEVFQACFREGAISVYDQQSFPKWAEILWTTELFFRESIYMRELYGWRSNETVRVS